MALKFSTGLRNAILGTGSFAGQLSTAVVRIFSGTAPATPDLAETGSKLCETSQITWGTPADGKIDKTGAVVSGTNLLDGTATYFRVVNSADTGVSSASLKRVQGSIGIAGTDMIVNSTNFVKDAITTLSSVEIEIPATASE